MSGWKAAKAPDNRTYYYRGSETTWDKPADFVEDSPGEWKEAVDADNKPYFWNTVTRESRREVPEAFLKQKQNAPALVAGGPHSYGGPPERRMDRRGDRDHGLPQKPSFDGGRSGGMPWEQRQDHGGFRGPMPVKTDEPEYATIEQAEEAFFKLLRKHNVSPTARWEDVLRTVVKEREYRALKDPKERRAAFEKYCVEARAQEKSKEKERRAKQREDYLKMLATHDDIKHYTRWKTARPIIEREVAYKSADDEDERRQLFEEYIIDLKKQHVDSEVEQHRMAIRQINHLLENNVKDVDAKWDEVAPSLMQQPGISKLDAVAAFENYMKSLERDTNAAKQMEKRSQLRSQRQARDDFKGLLHKLRDRGLIKVGTRWTEVYPLVKDDPRFIDITGNPGSSPLELFWDLVEDDERKVRRMRDDALDVLLEKEYEVTLHTSSDEFADVMRSDPRTAVFTSEEVTAVFEKIRSKVKRRVDDERHQDKRARRNAIDDLRGAIKRLEPAVRVGDSYEDVMSVLSSSPEYKALDDEGRRAAFDKHVERLKNEDEGRDRNRDRDRHRDSRRDRDRDRDRDGSRRDRERRHRTRTPEGDIYEADRRKAQADRERHYRKTSFGFTPPPRDRKDDRDDRYRRLDRHESMSVYDGERRQREHEGEKNYMSRADPRDRNRTLDYGDEDAGGSRPGSIRKRRDSEASTAGKRDAKRPRRSNGRTPDQEQTKEDPDAPALQSGSEEGEIEEV